MITIDQLLESVDLDFEPRFVTKNKNGSIDIWDKQPKLAMCIWNEPEEPYSQQCIIPHIKLADFADKPWQECIYEVPRKTTGKIELLKETTERVMLWKINELVDAVNELKGAKNE